MKEKIALVSIVLNSLLSAGKLAAGILTGSSAVLAEGFHSFMDIIASAISFVGIKMSQKPGDREHPYGHYKFEVLAGVLITVILFMTGLGIVREAWQGFMYPQQIHEGYLAYAVMFFSAIMNGIISWFKINIGKKENSMALLSDGVHSQVDFFVSLAVMVGLVLSRFWIHADALLTLLIGLYIIKESLSLGKEASDSLLDASAGDETEEKIRMISERNNVHVVSVKTQKKGSAITANLVIALPGNLNVDEASKVSDTLRAALVSEIEHLVYVVTQIESGDVTIGYYRPTFGRRYRWKQQHEKTIPSAISSQSGPGGYCICPHCGYTVVHQKGVPCASVLCPRCNTALERKQE